MNIFNTIKTVKSILEAKALTDSKGQAVTIFDDPDNKMEDSTPFIFITEGGDSEFINSPNGTVREYLHHLEISGFVDANKEKYDDFMTEASNLGKAVVDALQGDVEYDLRFIPKKIHVGQVLVGSLKCAGALSFVDVLTDYTEREN